jgi:OCT family organic cation transporter-like MFS transporter 4/5
MCKGDFATSLIGVSGFLGVAIGCLFLPRMGDLYGRKPIFAICLTIQAPLLIVITWTKSNWVAYGAIFLWGPCIIGRMACGFLLIMELVHSRNAPRVGAALMVVEGSVLIIWTIYFKYVSQNAFILCYATAGLNVLLAILIWFVPESPRWYFGMERFEEARAIIDKMARLNGKDFRCERFQEEFDIYIEEADFNDASPRST